jgi:hypothetical protein
VRAGKTPLTGPELQALIAGRSGVTDDTHRAKAHAGAVRTIEQTCAAEGIPLGQLSIDETPDLIRDLLERDTSEPYTRQAARNTPTVSLLVALPAAAGGDLAELLAVTDSDLGGIRHVHAADTSALGLGGDLHVLCHVHPDDILALGRASGNDLVTLPVSGVGEYSPAYGSGVIKPLPGGATLVETAGQLHLAARLDGPRIGNHVRPGYTWWRTSGGYSVPSPARAPRAVFAPAPDGAVGDTYRRLLEDGWTARAARDAAHALEAPVNAHSKRPSLDRVIQVQRGADNPSADITPNVAAGA